MRAEFPIKYKKISIAGVLDKKVFKVCDIKEKEVGLIKKQYFYIHFDGKQWKVLKLSAEGIDYYKIE